MFKVGDIVKFHDNYYDDLYQSYTVIDRTTLTTYRLKGLKNNQYRLLPDFALEIDLLSTRKLKIKKICSKSEMK